MRSGIIGAVTRDLQRDPDCGICRSLTDATPLYSDDLWHVRSLTAGVAGWLMLISQRHCPGPAHMDDDEARAFGPALRHFESLLQEISGAERIYTAALGESNHHMHVHMVPRYAEMPKGAIGWSVFDLERACRAGEVTVDAAEATRIHEAFAEALRKNPPPSSI